MRPSPEAINMALQTPYTAERVQGMIDSAAELGIVPDELVNTIIRTAILTGTSPEAILHALKEFPCGYPDPVAAPVMAHIEAPKKAEMQKCVYWLDWRWADTCDPGSD